MDLTTAINKANENVGELAHQWKTNKDIIAHYQPFYDKVKDQCESIDFFISICIGDFKMKQSGKHLISSEIIKKVDMYNPEEEFMNQGTPTGKEAPKKKKNNFITKLISIFWSYFYILPSSVVNYYILNLFIPIPFYIIVLILLCQNLMEEGFSIAGKYLQKKLSKHGRS